MFWTKRGQRRERAVRKIEGALWRHMVSQQGVTVNTLQNLRRVERHGLVEDKPVIMIRMFDPATADKQGAVIDDYESLDKHPELILYEGYYCESRGRASDIHIEKR